MDAQRPGVTPPSQPQNSLFSSQQEDRSLSEKTDGSSYGETLDGPQQQSFQSVNAFTAGTRFSVGSVLHHTFDALKKNPLVFFGLTFIAAIVPAIIKIVLYSQSVLGEALAIIVGYIFGLLIQGATSSAIYLVARNETTTIGKSLKHGLARFLPMLGAVTIKGLFYLGGAAIIYMAPSILWVFLLIPLIIALCILEVSFAVTIPACVVERLGPLESLQRSARLTKSYRSSIFGAMFITYLLIFAVNWFFISNSTLLFSGFVTLSIVSDLVQIFPQTLQNTLGPTIYYDLRAAKEGVSVDALVNVFD